MNVSASKWLLASVLSISLSACTSDHVRNPDFPQSGPVWIKKAPPVVAPAPEPVPEPVMSVSEQNSLAIENLGKQGFETEESEKGVIVFLPPNIYFQGSKSNISLDAREKIAQIASEVNQEYLLERSIEVSGHTDSIGAADGNMSLSKLRAEAAAEELVFSKVNRDRLKVLWFGETQPRIADPVNGILNREDRALNRRVEFTILNPQ